MDDSLPLARTLTSLTLTRPDGRTVGYADFGPATGAATGLAVIDCHGGPGSRLAPGAAAAAAGPAGIRFVGIDRPGYGLSTPWPGRTIAGWVPDALAVADALGIDRFAVIGSSTGGSYGVALAALAPERVIGLLLCCAVTDMRWPEGRRLVGGSGRAGDIWDAPDRATALEIARDFWGDDGLRPATSGSSTLAPADVALFLDPEFVRGVLLSLQQSFAFGVVGYTDDRIADGAGWGELDLAAVTCPVTIVHGAEDRLVDVRVAHHNKALLPHAELRVVDGLGHFSIGRELLPALFDLLGLSAAA
jgi:pimeloyl-ACP methyl ester carboxylesterase